MNRITEAIDRLPEHQRAAALGWFQRTIREKNNGSEHQLIRALVAGEAELTGVDEQGDCVIVRTGNL